MAIYFRWLDSQRRIYLTHCEGFVSESDFALAMQAVGRAIQDGPVYLVLDFTEMMYDDAFIKRAFVLNPPDDEAVAQLDHIRKIVFVLSDGHPLRQVFAHIYVRLGRRELIAFCPTLADAQDYLVALIDGHPAGGDSGCV